jgi:hypothetical protein
MNLTIKPKNRRQFLKKFSSSAAIIALAPNVIFAQSTANNKIGIGFSNTPPETILKISTSLSQNQNFVVEKNHLKTELLYVHAGTFEKELLRNTILIINQQNFDSDSLNYLKNICHTNKTFLLVVENNLSESTSIMFNKAFLYEPYECNSTKIDTIIKSISCLNQLTQPNQFFIS